MLTPPVRFNVSVLTPILKLPSRELIEVLNPDNETKFLFTKSWGNVEIATKVPFESYGAISRFVIELVATLILVTSFPSTSLILALAVWDPRKVSKRIFSPTW